MPNSQTLNLYLDLSQAQGSQDGLFADNATGKASKVWLNGATPPVQTPDHALTVSFAAGVATGLQVVINLPSGWSFVDVNGYCLRFYKKGCQEKKLPRELEAAKSLGIQPPSRCGRCLEA